MAGSVLRTVPLFALGEKFDVDSFLAQGALTPDFVWRQMGNGPTNGLELLLGDSEAINLPEQEKMAIEYLKQHRDILRNLAQYPGVEAVNLGLVYRLPRDATGFCVGPSRALMLHSLDSGVRPNYYVTVLGRGFDATELENGSE